MVTRILQDEVTDEEFHRNLLAANVRGHVQRASAATRAALPPGGGDPAYGNELLSKWSYGLRSAQNVQREALLAFKAGARGGHLAELSNLGAQGTQPQNCSADLMQLVRRILGLAIIPLYIALVPLYVTKSATEDGKPQPEMCPMVFYCRMCGYGFCTNTTGENSSYGL